ncbi:MAG TPA: tetratricopeptide repeat protein [bacterium]|jgi:predicted ATPase/class 3 adenylate cyclase|nr:tetratricopeptide repeat protein [bacterium]
MPRLPTGTVTFLFTDIEGSTRLIQEVGDAEYAHALAKHRHILRGAVEAHSGVEIETQGDGFLIAFESARHAVIAAVEAQRAVAAQRWPGDQAVRVRMGLHSGEPVRSENGYAGLDVHRAARICQVGHGGQILLSQTTRDLVEDDVHNGVSLRDLGEHRLKDLARPQHLFAVVIEGLPSDFPPLRTLTRLANNLPIQVTSFVGREREKAEVTRLLSTTRLLTLTGAGGAGKTRLALQVAAEVLEEFADGVWLAELARISDPLLVPHTVASALGVREQSNRPMSASLTESLQFKHVLLVLDNCEHMIQACADLADVLLRACPHLRIMATSREPLSMGGEVAYRVPSLGVPDLRDLPPLERLVEHEAIRLFVERASFASPTFRVTDQNASAVAQVCTRLDGIPLAIELAAARVKAVTVERIAERLDDRFRLLTGGSRAALPRHQTLRGAMDWSYDLLPDMEQVLFRRLSVFAGGFTLEAAEAVCSGDDLDRREILDLLSRLVDKSLIAAEAQNGEVRYRQLETVRQYATARLAESAEISNLRHRHRDFFVVLASEAEPHLTGAQQSAWLDRLETEHDNLRAALEKSRDDREAAEAVFRLIGALWWFWFVRGYWGDARKWLDWLEAALADELTGSPAARAKAAYGAGLVAFRMGNADRAEAFSETSLSLCRKLNDKQGIAFSMFVLGTVALNRRNLERAAAFLEESQGLFRALKHEWGLARSLNSLGVIAQERRDYEGARRLFEESMTLSRGLHDGWGLATSLNRLGEVARLREDHQQARAHYNEALTLFRELGDKPGIATILHNLGYIELQDGDLPRAGERFRESLRLFRELGHKRLIAFCLVGLGGLAHTQGRAVEATKLLSAADAVFDEEPPVEPTESQEHAYHQRTVAAVRAALNEDVFAAAWAEGRAMDFEKVLEHALGVEFKDGP